MKRVRALFLLPLLAACGHLMDRDGVARAISNDPEVADALGGDAIPKLEVKPGEKHFLPRGDPADRQVHLYSRQRDRTSVVQGRALRDGQVVILASYPGAPPPPAHLVRTKKK